MRGGVRDATCDMLKKGGDEADIGAENVFAHKPEVIAAIYPRLDSEKNRRACTSRIFRECGKPRPNGEVARPMRLRRCLICRTPPTCVFEIAPRSGDVLAAPVWPMAAACRNMRHASGGHPCGG